MSRPRLSGLTVRSVCCKIGRTLATIARRLRSGLYAGHSPKMALAALHKYLARVQVDELHTIRQVRAAGTTWAEIAAELGMTESGARRKYSKQGIS